MNMKYWFFALSVLTTGSIFLFKPSPSVSQSSPRCMPYTIESFGRSSAAIKKAREARAKRRAIRRWERAVEGRLLGARGVAIPAAGTDYSNFDNAEVVSFNCSGRPLKCVLIARPCRS